MELSASKFTGKYLGQYFDPNEKECLSFLVESISTKQSDLNKTRTFKDIYSSSGEREISNPHLKSVVEQVFMKYGRLKNHKNRMAIHTDILKNHTMTTKTTASLYCKLLHIEGYVEQHCIERMLLSLRSLNSDRERNEYFCGLIFKYPFGIMGPLPKNINKVIGRLDKKLFGMAKAKKKLKEYLSLLLFTQGKGRVSPLLLVGAPGTGKTSLAYAVADVLGLPFIKISMSGNYDIASVKGSASSWVSGRPGSIIQEMSASGCSNPVMLLDEIDKSGSTSAGSVLNILVELLDGKQNNSYVDSYLNFPVDLSKVIYICTANRIDLLPNYLVDRCYVIKVEEYSKEEREEIIRRYFPEQIIKEELGIRSRDFKIKVSAGAAKRLSSITSLRKAKRQLLSLVADKISEEDDMDQIRTININEYNDLPEAEKEKKEIGFLR